MTVPMVAVIAMNRNKNMASLIEAKNSTNSRENSSHPTPGAGVRGVSCSDNVSGRPFIGVTLPVPSPDTQSLRPGNTADWARDGRALEGDSLILSLIHI